MIAYADNYMQTEYYLAAQADEVYLHPDGVLLLQGFGGYRNYYKEGSTGSASRSTCSVSASTSPIAEPYLRNDMSPEAREMALDVYGDLWRDYLADVAAARKLQPAGHHGADRDAAGEARAGGRRPGEARAAGEAGRQAGDRATRCASA